MNPLAPVVKVYRNGTSWQLASLSGEEAPRRVLVRGPETLVDLAGKAFPEAEVRAEARGADPAWPDLIVEATPSPAPARNWVDRLFSRPPAA
jgi:hypothetical protein